MRVYEFPYFTMTYDTEKGIVKVLYGEHCSLIEPNKDHAYHANLLGLTAVQTNLLHELAHQVVAIYAYKERTCPIVFNSAYHLPMPADAQRREWLITAISYFSRAKNMRHLHEWNAIGELSAITDVWQMASTLCRLIEGYPADNIKVSYRKSSKT